MNKNCAMKPEFSDSTGLQLLSWGTGQNRNHLTCMSHIYIYRECPQGDEMHRDISKASQPNEPISKQPKTLDEIENPNHGDCELCKTTSHKVGGRSGCAD